MALNLSPENLLRECENAEVWRDKKLHGVDVSLARLVGPDRAERTSLSPAPRNVEYEYCSYLEAVLAYDRPVVSFESPLVSSQDEVLALEVAMNRWISDTKVRQVLSEAVPDFCVAWAVLFSSVAPSKHLGEVSFTDGNGATRRGIPNRPYIKRIPFGCAFKDPASISPYSWRFAGHTEIADKDDIIREAEEEGENSGWYLDVLRALPTDADLRKAGRVKMDGMPPRDEVAMRKVWVADAEIDWDKHKIAEKDRHLYHGMVFTLGVALNNNDVRGVFLREPEPFFGPRWGPYTWIGAHVVPNDSEFLSPIQPMRTSIDRLNAVNDVAAGAMEKYKKLILVNDLVENLADIIKSGKHDHVFQVPGYEGGAAEVFEVGGVTNQMASHLAMMEGIVDKGLGLSDVQRGAVSGQGSATEVALATESASARISVLERQWNDGVAQALLTNAWFFWHDDEVVQPISIQEALQVAGNDPEAASRMVKMDKNGQPVVLNGKVQFEQQAYRGGTQNPDSFDSLTLEIQPYSVKHMNERDAQARAMWLQNFVVTVGPLPPVMPWVDWGLVQRLMSKWMRTPELRNIFNLQAAAEMAQSQALARYAAENQADGPQTAKDAGGTAPVPPKPAAPASQNQQTGQGGAANAASMKPPPMPGRSSGGTQGNLAASKAGAA